LKEDIAFDVSNFHSKILDEIYCVFNLSGARSPERFPVTFSVEQSLAGGRPERLKEDVEI
jgi:hypothetical protein